MSQRTTKETFEEARKWIILLCMLFSTGLISFVVYAGRSEVKSIVREELKAYVSTAEFTADKAAAKELRTSETKNISDQLVRMETDFKDLKADVKELRDFLMPKKRGIGLQINRTNDFLIAR